ncbi:zinc transporter ZntB [Marinagarivorans algicola]|uniref:zinc transporter ZntB n=1 Tax=Marinagarivorans algicola TaxID=1513270 RepID=UPI0006B5B695|nr:zinc transporter ZntB [Marinagarivorans algicola]
MLGAESHSGTTSQAINQEFSSDARPYGLVCGYIFKEGQAKAITLEDYARWQAGDGLIWLHFDIRNARARQWLSEHSGLSETAVHTLLSEETRPHVWREDDSLIMALRSINFHPNAEPEDMVAVRAYADKHKMITARRRSLTSLRDLAGSMADGVGPASIAHMLIHLTGSLTMQLVSAIDSLEDKMDALEAGVLDDFQQQRRVHVMELRRKCILLRRYLAPQREALARIYIEPISWIDERVRMQQRHIADQLVRYVESLDAVKDRAAVVQEELASRVADQLNTRMYILSVVAALFLPLGFILSVFQLKVLGKPLVEYPLGLPALVLAIIIAVSAQVIIFKRKGWL